MLDFLIPKTKVRAHGIRGLPIEQFEVIGVGQINPYCQKRYENEIFLTLVNIIADNKKFDEREGLVISSYFTLRKCPECGRLKLLPTKIRLNTLRIYLKNEKDLFYQFDNSFYEDRATTPSEAFAYCNCCNSCFKIFLKSNDIWAKEAKKVKEREIITGFWDEFRVRKS